MEGLVLYLSSLAESETEMRPARFERRSKHVMGNLWASSRINLTDER